MVIRFALLAALIAAALVVVRNEHVLQNAGLTGYCHRVATPAGQTGFWNECVPGKLTGTPGLSRGSCVRVRHTAAADLWRCPTELESDKARQ